MLGEPLASMAGDAFADDGFGGGPMIASDSGSGDIDSDDEVGCPRSERTARGEVGDWWDCEWALSKSLTSLEGTEMPLFFLRCMAFAIGDCPTFLVVRGAAPRLVALRMRPGC